MGFLIIIFKQVIDIPKDLKIVHADIYIVAKFAPGIINIHHCHYSPVPTMLEGTEFSLPPNDPQLNNMLCIVHNYDIW